MRRPVGAPTGFLRTLQPVFLTGAFSAITRNCMPKTQWGSVRLGAALLALALYGCHPHPSGESRGKQPLTLAPAPAFQADSAYAYVQKQVDFGPRIPNTPAQEACAAWLTETMKAFADSVTVQRTQLSSRGQQYRCINIIGHFNPAAQQRILLLAHWDTRAFADADSTTRNRHFDGADDGASGVGVLLEIARQLHLHKTAVGVDILLADVEDAGVEGDDNSWALGTQYWARQAKSAGYRAQYGILLDMVGGKGAHFYREAMTRQYASAQSEMVWNVANQIGYSDYFRYANPGGAGVTDDHVFVNRLAGIPTMDIIHLRGDGSFVPWHHTVNDNMGVIDKNTLGAVGQTVLQTIYANPPY